MLALVAVMIVLGTGVAWGSVRSFEGGIFHFATAVLGAGGGKDGALDIMLVGMDSRTDAHGNPLPAEELAQLHAGDDVATGRHEGVGEAAPHQNGQSLIRSIALGNSPQVQPHAFSCQAGRAIRK